MGKNIFKSKLIFILIILITLTLIISAGAIILYKYFHTQKHGDHFTINKAMKDRFAWSVDKELSPYNNKFIKLKSPVIHEELITKYQLQNFDEQIIFSNGNFQFVYFTRKDNKQQPTTQDYAIHQPEYAKQTSRHSLLSLNMLAPLPPNKALAENTNQGWEILNSSHILQLTGFESQEQMKSFILIHHKLISYNSQIGMEYNDSTLSRYTPLLFDEDYAFSTHHSEESQSFLKCDHDFTGNLKANYDPQSKSVKYFAHASNQSVNDSLVRITLAYQDSELKLDVENLIQCSSEIIC